MHHTGYTRVNSLEIQSKSIGTQENRYSIVIHKLDIYSVVGGITVFYLQNDRVLVKGNTTDTKEGRKDTNHCHTKNQPKEEWKRIRIRSIW